LKQNKLDLTFTGSLQYHAIQRREQIIEEDDDVPDEVERQIAQCCYQCTLLPQNIADYGGK